MRTNATSSRTLSVEAFVLAWPGNEKSAQCIQNEVRPCVDSVTVLYNSPTPLSDVKVPEGWIDLGGDAYFAAKFEHARQVARSDVQIFIPADCHVENWANLISRCRSAFAQSTKLAIWAPHTAGTAWTPERTMLRKHSRSTLSVTAVDSLIWALKGSFLKNLPDLDFSNNTFGWGIETAVAAEAHRSGKLIVLDTSLTYGHVRGSAYNANHAERGEIDFFRTLPGKNLEIVRRIQYIFTHRKQAETVPLKLATSAKLSMQVLLLSLPKRVCVRRDYAIEEGSG